LSPALSAGRRPRGRRVAPQHAGQARGGEVARPTGGQIRGLGAPAPLSLWQLIQPRSRTNCSPRDASPVVICADRPLMPATARPTIARNRTIALPQLLFPTFGNIERPICQEPAHQFHHSGIADCTSGWMGPPTVIQSEASTAITMISFGTSDSVFCPPPALRRAPRNVASRPDPAVPSAVKMEIAPGLARPVNDGIDD